MAVVKWRWRGAAYARLASSLEFVACTWQYGYGVLLGKHKCAHCCCKCALATHDKTPPHKTIHYSIICNHPSTMPRTHYPTQH